MGWSFVHREKGMTTEEFFRQEIIGPDEDIVSSKSDRHVFYMAIRLKNGHVIGVVALTERAHRSYHNYGYKIVSEDMGPFEAFCPAKILKELSPVEVLFPDSPTSQKCASEWRQKCLSNLANPPVKVKAGDIVIFNHSLSFMDGHESDTFRFIERSTFQDPDTGQLYRISNWKNLRYEVAS